MSVTPPNLYPGDTDGVLLHRAAVLMRIRATAANTTDARTPYSDHRIAAVPESGWGDLIINYLGGDTGIHCSTWTPAVATAIADQLDLAADQFWCGTRAPLIAIARAYLNEPAPEDTAVAEPAPPAPAADAHSAYTAVAVANVVTERNNHIDGHHHQPGMADADPYWLTAPSHERTDGTTLNRLYTFTTPWAASSARDAEESLHGGTWAGAVAADHTALIHAVAAAHHIHHDPAALRAAAVTAAATLIGFIEAIDRRGLNTHTLMCSYCASTDPARRFAMPTAGGGTTACTYRWHDTAGDPA